jgi:hypothetical protein
VSLIARDGRTFQANVIASRQSGEEEGCAAWVIFELVEEGAADTADRPEGEGAPGRATE